MSLDIIKGNLFTSNCQTLVNTVNCVGVMGAGIALEFRLRYPQMYERYVEICNSNLLDIGKLWLYKSEHRWVLNFPTKKHWKRASKIEFLQLGLQKFVDTYEKKGITSIAFPLLGSLNGGISENESLEIMTKYLYKCDDIKIEIYIYEANSLDDIFHQLKTRFLSLSDKEILNLTGLQKIYLTRVKDVMQDDSICSLSQFISVKGIGINTVQKALLIINANK
ncbi:hypothetical protein NIES267_42160 [Calothrix parasitica NIES-267]|uniref:Macro domain-containing protein n=1 Tax=Calothrix parasitica NIES-267 TaxID=1973488 RepID=A0A1Z4LTZ7_9CYAN|nr:hypothetical protein NIES267_42160 [Calothrix parasitica NIES-267]